MKRKSSYNLKLVIVGSRVSLCGIPFASPVPSLVLSSASQPVPSSVLNSASHPFAPQW